MFRRTIVILSALAASVTNALANDLTQEQARQELEQVQEFVLGRHPDPFWFNDESVWQERLGALRARTGDVSHVEQYFDLASLLSLAMDTHVQIYPVNDTPGFERSYPLRFRLYEEGVFITAADNPYRDWVGARVIAINGISASTIVDEMQGYAFSDHPERQRSWAVEHYLIHPATYSYFGWMNDEGGVELSLEMFDGGNRQVVLDQTLDESMDAVLRSGRSEGYYWPDGWRTLDDLTASPTPLSRQRLDESFWYSDLNGGEVVYLQFNSSSHAEGEQSFLEFTIDVFEDIAARETPPSRIILDIRANLGGWIGRSLPLPYLVQVSGICCERGSVVLLTGRETISAGSVFAGVTEIATRAVTIGEPTGGRPNIFLGHSGITLPHSGLEPEASSEVYYSTDTSDDRMAVFPDVVVRERFSDAAAGRDAALEAALALSAETATGFYPGDTPARPWARPSQQSSNWAR
ncbi:hypothetical protein [Maricaulis maris]|uniref:hypothetical protein n=1 Tax=Maricaulis maris TaxID=74318 RepID=UPI003B8D324E